MNYYAMNYCAFEWIKKKKLIKTELRFYKRGLSVINDYLS